MRKELFCIKLDNNKNDWSEAISALKVDKLLNADPSFLARYITVDKQEISERQAIFRDCFSDSRIADGVRQLLGFVTDIKQIRENMRVYSKDIERTLYSVRVIELYLDAVASANTIYENVCSGLRSERLKSFFGAFHEVFASKEYKKIEKYTKECYRSAKTVKSFTVGINLNAKLEPVEMGIIAMNDREFVTSNFFTELFGGKEGYQQYVTPFVSYKGKNQLLERSMYLTMNDCLCKAISSAFRDILKGLDDITQTLIGAEYDLRFLNLCCSYLSELRNKRADVCFPTFSDCELIIKEAVSPFLMSKMKYHQIVPNDILFSEKGTCVYILTGANNGGKSIYVDMVGILQILFQLGLCVTAKQASMCSVSCLYVHFSADMNYREVADESRFAFECKRMKEILSKAKEASMILMDESFSGTSSVEGAAVAAQVLNHICHKRCFCVYSTHIHELSGYIDELNKRWNCVTPMCVKTENGRRTYKIRFGENDELSHAYDIAAKYGLAFLE